MRDSSLAADVLKGAIAGAAATWAMAQVTTWLYERQAGEVTKREEQARPGGAPATTLAVRKVATTVGVRPGERAEATLASAFHRALGITAAAVYAAARRSRRGFSVGGGLALGLTVFAVMDEGVNWAFGFSGPPAAYPWQTHARGLAGHVAYGVAAEGVRAALDRVA